MIAILASIIVLLSIYIWRFYENVKRYPKGPTPLPFIGNLHKLNWSKLHLDISELSKEYGNVFTIWLPKPYVCIMDMEDIKTAFKGDDLSGRTRDFPDTMFQNIKNGGLIFSDGDEWKEQRRTSLHILREFGMGKNVMEHLVSTSMKDCLDHLSTIENKDSIDLRLPIMVANVITKTLYGFNYTHNNCERLKLFAERQEHVFAEVKKSKLTFLAQTFGWIAHIPIIGYYAVGKYKDLVKPMKDIIVGDIATALENYDKDEEASCFVQAYYQKMESNPYLSMEQLINVCMDFYLAGSGTTSTTLRWAVLHMAAHQHVQDKMREEIARVVGFDRLVSLTDRTRMAYCGAAICEIQRHANIVPLNVFHRATVDTVIGGHRIPDDTMVIGQISHVMKHSSAFKESDSFLPERFLMEDGVTPNKETLDQFAPFSIGKRQCAGESMAKMELFIGLVSILQNYKIEPCNGEPIDLEPIYAKVLVPKPQKLKLTQIASIWYEKNSLLQ